MSIQSISWFFLALPNACLLAWGWRRMLYAVLAGAVTALALPPYGLVFAPLIGFPCLVWLLDGALAQSAMSKRRRFSAGFPLGWLFGLGYFLASLWWIGSAFLVEADRFAWLMPFAVVLMPAGLALFTGIGTACAALVWRGGWRRVLALAVFLSAADWARGHVLTGFPWNSFGYLAVDSLELSQLASVVGLYGLGFFAVLIAASPAPLIDMQTARRAAIMPAIMGLALLAVWLSGYTRLHGTEPAPSDEVNIRIVQPSIEQSEKWKPENREAIFQQLLDLTRAPLQGEAKVGLPQIVVWPESAVPFLLTREPGAMFRIAQALPEQSMLVTGAIRAEADAGQNYFYNSIYVIDTNGMVLDLYDKIRLVPFGEYLPLEPFLSRIGITALVNAPSAFKPGLRHRPLTVDGLPAFLPLVCYEAIFPRLASNADASTGWLLNVTNDAWFGRTLGPHQHLAQAQLRAIEQGIPLIRAANTGISAIIDSKGRVLSRLNLFQTGVVDSKLPGRQEHTIYASYGDVMFGILLFIGCLGLFSGKYNRDSRFN